jgi:hypothetical protein
MQAEKQGQDCELRELFSDGGETALLLLDRRVRVGSRR